MVPTCINEGLTIDFDEWDDPFPMRQIRMQGDVTATSRAAIRELDFRHGEIK
jgi:hypothetical protein